MDSEIAFLVEMQRAWVASPTQAGYYELPSEDSHATPTKSQVRSFVWHRDHGRCHVCGRMILPEWYECGHIVDRWNDGVDRPSNLVVMCRPCNQLKPFHASRTEYLQWIANGAWMAELGAKFEALGIVQPQREEEQ